MFKFRGKTESGEWVIGNYAEFVNYLDGAVRPGIQITRQVPSSFDRFIPAFETELVEVIPETVSPGVEIDGKWYFVGDVCFVYADFYGREVKHKAIIKQIGNAFYFDYIGSCFTISDWSQYHKIEIIGNKWDNPELEVGE